MITYEEWLNDWRFFCSLCTRFQSSIQFVDDKIDPNTSKLINGNTFSNEFNTMLLLVCAEFENISRQICSTIDPNFKASTANIRVFTTTITTHFPKLRLTEISSPVQSKFRPLENWAYSNPPGECSGIEWWDDNGELKHHRYPNLDKATLQNCYDALASLFVLELYAAALIMPQDHNSFDFDPMYELSSNPCPYFSSEYYRDLIWPAQKELPDFS